jgi:hypothetical protein
LALPEKRGKTREHFMANCESTWRQVRIGAFYLSAILLFLPTTLIGKTKPPVLVNPSNPLNFGPIPNYTKPVRNSISSGAVSEFVKSSESLLHWVLDNWTLTLSASYDFLNDRSRVGGLSVDSDSAIIDLTGNLKKSPWTWFDLSYIYSHAHGTAPGGTSQTGYQNAGGLRILQPFPLGPDWKPAVFTSEPTNNQMAIIFSSNYGGSFSTTNIPQLSTIHSSARTYLGDALFDYQFTWFPDRKKQSTGDKSALDKKTYPSLLVELSSGLQFSTTRLRTSDNVSPTTSSGQQLTYQNICCATYSFPCRFGLLFATEWDSPLYSQPFAGSQPFYANTATFTGGIVYNIYSYQRDTSDFLSHLSGSLLYSYTAFNPLVETNQVQVQLSYSF